MENMTQKASQMSDEIKVAGVEIKVAGEPGILAIPGHARPIIRGDDFKQDDLWFFPPTRPIIRGDDFKQDDLWFFPPRIEDYIRKFFPVEMLKGPTDQDHVDLESGVKKEEVVCECYWKNECLNYVIYANDLIERIVQELKDKGNALKFISVERVKELKDEGYGLMCIPFEPVKGLKDDGHALKFIPVETVKVSKDDGCELKFIPVETVKELKAHGYALFIPAEIVKKLKDAYNIKMESGGMIETVLNKSWLKNKCIEYVGYANDYIEKTVKPEMGLLFSGATMQNIYQLVTSGMVNTGKGKTLLKLNEAAFMMLLYGLIMPRRAAGHVALAIGVALASAAYLVTMTFAL